MVQSRCEVTGEESSCLINCFLGTESGHEVQSKPEVRDHRRYHWVS